MKPFDHDYETPFREQRLRNLQGYDWQLISKVVSGLFCLAAIAFALWTVCSDSISKYGAR